MADQYGQFGGASGPPAPAPAPAPGTMQPGQPGWGLSPPPDQKQQSDAQAQALSQMSPTMQAATQQSPQMQNYAQLLGLLQQQQSPGGAAPLPPSNFGFGSQQPVGMPDNFGFGQQPQQQAALGPNLSALTGAAPQRPNMSRGFN